MDTLTEISMLKTMRNAAIKERGRSMRRRVPRRCMVVSLGLILAGLSIPALMVINLLPITFLLAFAGFALAESGAVMALVFCGEL